MSDQSAERRRFDRIATDKPVVIHDGDTQHDGVVRDVSLQGMLFTLASDWRPPHGIRLHASVRLEGELCCIDMEKSSVLPICLLFFKFIIKEPAMKVYVVYWANKLRIR